MLFAVCAAAMLAPRDGFRAWGLDILKEVRRDYLLPNSKLYADSIENGKPSGPSFCWGVGVAISALNVASQADASWKDDLREYVYATRVYWNDKGPVPGYDVLPGPKDVDRYYDDNEWMVMALADASTILNDKKILGWAEDTLRYVLSGEDDKLGGGIYWHEPKKDSKNTCSNGPAVAACLAIYQRTGNPDYLKEARKLYDWTKKTLEDPRDALFWDNVNLAGKVDATKFSYNTALMIRSAAILAKITGETGYKLDAVKMANESEERWVDPQTGAIKDTGKFAHLLLESWSYVPTAARREKARHALDWLHAHCRTSQGMYGSSFDHTPDPNQAKFELIDEVSAARAFLEAPK